MKTLLLILAFTILPLSAGNLTLEWDKPSVDDAAIVAGTRLYERKADGTVVRIGAVQGAQTSEITIDFSEGRHVVYATFFTAEGIESPPSDDLVFTVPKKPGKPRIKVAFQASADMQTWNTLTLWEPAEEDTRGFYRVHFTD